jgi:hypothetical protein
MNKKYDGGPAFPATIHNGLTSGWPGISLRDYFAAKAMRGLIARQFTKDDSDRAFVEWVSAVSYEMADEMLKARTQ